MMPLFRRHTPLFRFIRFFRFSAPPLRHADYAMLFMPPLRLRHAFRVDGAMRRKA
jgi:hypothetical protein